MQSPLFDYFRKYSQLSPRWCRVGSVASFEPLLVLLPYPQANSESGIGGAGNVRWPMVRGQGATCPR